MNAVLSRLARWPIGGVAIALMAILAHWDHNALRLGFESAWPTLTIAAGLALATTVLLRLCCGSWTRAGTGAALVAMYVFYVPELLSLVRVPYAAAVLLHIGAVCMLSLIWLRLPRDQAPLESVSGKLNAIVLFMLAVTAVPTAARQIQLEHHRARARESFGVLDGKPSGNAPDVWHIVFDRYAGADTLKERYSFDNGAFIEALRQRGFVVPDRAYSNYQRTGHSIASTMNGVLLDRLAAPMREESGDWVPIYRGMRDGAAIRLFKRMGYRTVFAGSWWEPTRFSTVADESVQFRAMPQLARVALDRSALGFWLRGVSIPWLDGRADQCFRANEKFKRLREIAREPARKYVFAHFLVPHPPFVLNADGSCKPLDSARRASRRDNYISQVRFVNREALALVDAITRGPRPAVIIIHSDEGPWPEPYVGDEHGLGTDPVQVPWTRLTQQQLHEKMAILLAVRDPARTADTVFPDSPVQIYPALLRNHFGSRKALPPSCHQVFVSDRELYRFADVGDELEQRPEESSCLD